MPSGANQRKIWQHQAAVMSHQAQQSLETIRASLSRYDLLDSTRQRLEEAYEIAEASNQALIGLLREAGIEPQLQPELQNAQLGSLSEYYHHILQDWAWNPEIAGQRLQQVLDAAGILEAEHLLVLGSGAGRLSWDLHNRWNAKATLATDINPILLLASHKLIRLQESFPFYELNNFPQIERQNSAGYDLQPTQDLGDRRNSWHAMAADVWAMPIKPGSMDVIVTSWFIDVHGGDNRDLMGLILQWLKPGGVWVNNGPLLYPKHLPIDYKYDREELVELINLAGFDIGNESVDEQIHMDSPINVRTQTEQVWTFRAQKRCSEKTLDNNPPAWLMLHHLPVPVLRSPLQQTHPLIDTILSATDGIKSINQLSSLLAPQLPADVNARGAIIALLGEIAEENGTI